jgi:hypothetical protein
MQEPQQQEQQPQQQELTQQQPQQELTQQQPQQELTQQQPQQELTQQPQQEQQQQEQQYPLWIHDPSILFINELWPEPHMTIEQKINAISRLVILLTLLGFLITFNINILITGIITLGIFYFLYTTQKDKLKTNEIKEGFTPTTYNKIKKNKALTIPTPQNPLMNVLLPEIKYNPNRKVAAPAFNSSVEKDINASTKLNAIYNSFKDITNKSEAEKIKNKLFADLGDNFDLDNSMRGFYTMPNTTIPNDQGGFAKFCYGTMTSCKEGNETACTRLNPRIGSVIN